MEPKVSVCLDVFNYAAFLPRAIDSVLSQTMGDLELIIADDCSTDDSWAIAQSYADPRIRLVRNATNLGMIRNRNVALHAARGEWIKPLHADDFLAVPEALGRMVSLLEKRPSLSLVATAMQFVDPAGKPLGAWSRFTEGRLLSGTGVIKRCLREERNLIGGPSAVMFRRDRGRRGFNEGFFHMADLEMWFHLLEQGAFGFIAEPLCAYRRHAAQQTELDHATLSEADDYDALLKRYLDQPYVAFKPWLKAHLRTGARMRRARRSRALGMRADSPALPVRALHAATVFALRQARFIVRQWGPRISPAPPAHPHGINVCGFFQSEHGIGDSSRAIARTVAASVLPCAFVNIPSKVHRNAHASGLPLSTANPYRVNLMTFSFDYARRFQRDQGRRFFAGRTNIALWYWELEKLPPRWHACFDCYDEIWVTTEFCRSAIAAVSPIPVTKITHPLWIEAAPPDRARFGIEPDVFAFLFAFDYCSVLERKNPGAVIKAFRQAFGESKRAVLIFKTINSSHAESARHRLHASAEGMNVRFMDEHIPSGEMNALIASVDCYVSLHRAEGLGLGMAQAMALGKPVIATGYSGNMEFMNPANSLPIRYSMAELSEDCGPYPRGYSWAEPDVADASEKMQWVVENPPAAAALGAQGAEDIRRMLDPEITRREIVSRLGELNLAP